MWGPSSDGVLLSEWTDTALGDGTMRAAPCFMKRTKGQVFRWGRAGLWGLRFSKAGERVSDRCER